MQASQISAETISANEPGKFRSSISGRFAVRCVLAILVTFAGVHYSIQHGRLLRQPVADDANYMVDGLTRLEVFYQRGIGGVLHSWVVDPPHAPVSTFLAMGAFAVFGRHEWAPYAANGIIVLALLTVVDWLAGNVRPWQRGLIYAMVLCTRWPWTAVTEFRPDSATALLTAVGIIYCLRWPLMGSSTGRRIAVGVIFGTVLVFKPALAPVNFVILSVCLMTAISVDLILGGRKLAWREITTALLPTVVAGLVVALTYFAFGWKATYDYVHVNVFGAKKELWQAAIYTWQEKLSYYLARPGFAGSLILGIGHLYLLVVLSLVGVGLVLHRGNRSQKARALGLVLVGLVAYAIPTLAKMKNFFYGLDFQTLMLLAGVLTLRWLLNLQKPMATAGFVVACLASVVMFQSPRYLADQWTGSIVESNRLLGEVYGQVQHGQMGDRIFVPASGASVSWNTMNYLSLCDDSLRRFYNIDAAVWNDWDLINEQLDQADWVVVGDPGNSEARSDLPNGRQGQALYLAGVRARPAFAEVNTFPLTGGLAYHVFRRTTPAFFGFVEAQTKGLGGMAGPNPQWRLPITRAAMEKSTHLEISGRGGRVLVLSFACLIDDETISVMVNGKQVVNERCDKDDSFRDIRLPVDLPAGKSDVEIRYTKWKQPEGGGPVVLFKKIQVLAEE